MGLGIKLESIYTSGDSYTVLTLIRELIDAIKEYEATHKIYMYQHVVKVEFSKGYFSFTAYSNQSQSYTTLNDLLKDERDVTGVIEPTLHNTALILAASCSDSVVTVKNFYAGTLVGTEVSEYNIIDNVTKITLEDTDE